MKEIFYIGVTLAIAITYIDHVEHKKEVLQLQAQEARLSIEILTAELNSIKG